MQKNMWTYRGRHILHADRETDRQGDRQTMRQTVTLGISERMMKDRGRETDRREKSSVDGERSLRG